jgi:hypothetical protein
MFLSFPLPFFISLTSHGLQPASFKSSTQKSLGDVFLRNFGLCANSKASQRRGECPS